MRPALCIVVPVLDEADSLERSLRALRPLRERGARLVVVDGGSADSTLAIAREHADLAFVAPRGRASQMNAGAAACPADVLLFLHADTQLPALADVVVLRAMKGRELWGRFDVRLDSSRPLLRIVGAMMNLRSRLTGVCTGDQAMFVNHEVFVKSGGFPEIALMEDVAMCRDLRRFSKPVCLRQTVLASARRWEKNGVLRTILLMWRLRAAFFFGADPERLAVRYGYRAAE